MFKITSLVDVNMVTTLKGFQVDDGLMALSAYQKASIILKTCLIYNEIFQLHSSSNFEIELEFFYWTDILKL